MTKIQNFVVHSDFPSLANDASGEMQLTLPINSVIDNGATRTFQTSVQLGSKDASLRARITRNGTHWYVGTALTFPLSVRYDGFPGNTNIYVTAFIERTNDTTLRLFVDILNQGGATMRLSEGVTIQTKISTFITPF